MTIFRLQFSESIVDINLDGSQPDANENQMVIFSQMAIHITKFLDIETERFIKIIRHTAGKWQNEGETLFQYFEHATPQERLQVAVKFSDNIQTFLAPYLLNPDDKGELRKIIDHK